MIMQKSLHTPELDETILLDLHESKFVRAVKRYREVTGASLSDARRHVESVRVDAHIPEIPTVSERVLAATLQYGSVALVAIVKPEFRLPAMYAALGIIGGFEIIKSHKRRIASAKT